MARDQGLTTSIRVLPGDALAELGRLPDDSVDVVIADPPYNLGKDFGNNNDDHSFQDYMAFSEAWLRECRRILKSSGTLYVFMGVRFISYLYQIMDQRLGLHFNSWVCWHYTQGLGKTKGLSPRHDDILMFTKSEAFKFNLDAIRIPQKYYRERNNMRGANPGDVWKFSHVHYCHPNRQDHPTQKPEGLIERMVLASSDAGDTVVDPFAGSGTTPRVCQQLGRSCIAIEINPDFVAAIDRRLAQSFGGFDSIDPRAERVPLDLRNPEIRETYLKNHREWFLKNHQNALERFDAEVERLYGGRKGKQSQLIKRPAIIL
jgi:DNA modification methylase